MILVIWPEDWENTDRVKFAQLTCLSNGSQCQIRCCSLPSAINVLTSSLFNVLRSICFLKQTVVSFPRKDALDKFYPIDLNGSEGETKSTEKSCDQENDVVQFHTVHRIIIDRKF